MFRVKLLYGLLVNYSEVHALIQRMAMGNSLSANIHLTSCFLALSRVTYLCHKDYNNYEE